jgi:hypothetical protein
MNAHEMKNIKQHNTLVRIMYSQEKLRETAKSATIEKAGNISSRFSLITGKRLAKKLSLVEQTRFVNIRLNIYDQSILVDEERLFHFTGLAPLKQYPRFCN